MEETNMFKLLIHFAVDEAFALGGNQEHLFDTGVRITGPGERKFKEEAEVRGISYKPFLLDELVALLSKGHDNEREAAITILTTIDESWNAAEITSAKFVYPTSRTSWANGLYVTAGHIDDVYDGTQDEHPVRYRIQRYSNGYTEYEVEVPWQDNNLTLSGEHYSYDNVDEVPSVLGRFSMDDMGNEFREFLMLTQQVVR